MQAYQDFAPTSSIKSPRDSESEIILSVTRRLKRSAPLRATDYAAFVSAVHQNRRLWLLLSADVAQAGNKLPDQLKENISQISAFVVGYSRRILIDDLPMAPLIDINLAILRGLRGSEAKS